MCICSLVSWAKFSPGSCLVQCKQQSRSLKLEVATCGKTSESVLPEGWASYRSVLSPTFLLSLPAKCAAGSEQKPLCFCCTWFPLLGYQEASRGETRSVAVLCPVLGRRGGRRARVLLSSSCVLNMSLPNLCKPCRAFSWAGCSKKLSEHSGELKVAVAVEQANSVGTGTQSITRSENQKLYSAVVLIARTSSTEWFY